MMKTVKVLFRYGLTLIVILVLAMGWILLSAQPAIAQDRNVNYTYAQLADENFAHKDLVKAVFAAADLRRANFEGADLRGAIFTKATLLNTNLKEANLSEILGDRATFEGADLTHAIFREATVTSTNFANAQITGADFTDSLLDRYQVVQLCKYAEGINPVTGVATRDSLGCR